MNLFLDICTMLGPTATFVAVMVVNRRLKRYKKKAQKEAAPPVDAVTDYHTWKRGRHRRDAITWHIEWYALTGMEYCNTCEGSHKEKDNTHGRTISEPAIGAIHPGESNYHYRRDTNNTYTVQKLNGETYSFDVWGGTIKMAPAPESGTVTVSTQVFRTGDSIQVVQPYLPPRPPRDKAGRILK